MDGLPVVYADSPSIFEQVPASSLREWTSPKETNLVHYADDLLLTQSTQEQVCWDTIPPPPTSWERRGFVSVKL